jgi:hypothetical protein
VEFADEGWSWRRHTSTALLKLFEHHSTRKRTPLSGMVLVGSFSCLRFGLGAGRGRWEVEGFAEHLLPFGLLILGEDFHCLGLHFLSELGVSGWGAAGSAHGGRTTGTSWTALATVGAAGGRAAGATLRSFRWRTARTSGTTLPTWTSHSAAIRASGATGSSTRTERLQCSPLRFGEAKPLGDLGMEKCAGAFHLEADFMEAVKLVVGEDPLQLGVLLSRSASHLALLAARRWAQRLQFRYLIGGEAKFLLNFRHHEQSGSSHAATGAPLPFAHSSWAHPASKSCTPIWRRWATLLLSVGAGGDQG